MYAWFSKMRRSLTLVFALSFPLLLSAFAQTTDRQTPADSLAFPTAKALADSVKSLIPKQNRGLYKKLVAYLSETNKEKNRHKFDFSIIAGPHYSNDTKFALGIIAAGLYYTQPNDTLLPPSNVSLYADVSTTGFYLVGIKGAHIAPGQRHRMVYDASFTFFPTKFWGTGYHMGNNAGNEATMNRSEVEFKGNYLFRLAPNVYLGPALWANWMRAAKQSHPELLAGQPSQAADVGLGVAFELDTRDVMTAPHRGLYIAFTQMARQQLMNSRRPFFTTQFTLNAYRPLWRGATLAAQTLGVLQWGSVTWNSMALTGDSHSMRGYYLGRYRDINKLEAQAELRQHIYRRNGMVAWIGGATVFPRFSAMRINHILPSWGVGYRWEFKKNINLRLDYGWGKSGQSGFIFNVNEAF